MAFRPTTSNVRTPRYLNLLSLLLATTLLLGVVPAASHVMPSGKTAPNGVGVPSSIAEIAVDAFGVKSDLHEAESPNAMASESRMELPSVAPTNRGAPHVRTTPRVQRLNNKPSPPKAPSTAQSSSASQ